MLIVQTKIFISQVPSAAFPTRQNEYLLDFVCEFEAHNGWASFTDTCKITLPKYFNYRDTTGAVISNPANITGKDSNLGGFSSNVPLFLRGDQVTLIAGYQYEQGGKAVNDTAIIFEGYISKVSSKKPFVLECEDNMWQLKQLPAPNKVFPAAKYTVESMLAELLSGTPFTVNKTASTQLPQGDFRTQGESVMDIIARMRKDYRIESYFKGNELRCGYLVVYMDAGDTFNFAFQNNIIEDELEYNRKDDVVLSAIAYSVNKNKITTTTKDGATKTKTERLEVLVTFQNGAFRHSITPPGQSADYPPRYTGERRTFYFPSVTSTTDLVNKAQKELSKYYYTGFRGKFTTFGIPFVRQGDNANIVDPVLPERNGKYKIKSVECKLSVDGGLRQIIELDFKLP